MLKRRFGKKLIVSVMIMAVLMALLAMPAMAATDYPMIAMADSSDLAVVGEIDDFETMTVLGLDVSYVTHDLGVDEQYVTWTTSDEDVVLFDDGNDYVDTIIGSDTVDVALAGLGTAVVTATYDTPSAPPVTVTSYIEVVDPNAPPATVTGIDVAVDFSATAEDAASNPLADFNATYDVPYFTLDDIYGTIDDDDVMKTDVTALHAFLYALEIQFSSETTSTPIGSFNWDWVEANVDISSQGSYLNVVGTDDGNVNWIYKWQFTVNTVDPGHAACVTPLSNSDDVTWGFLPW